MEMVAAKCQVEVAPGGQFMAQFAKPAGRLGTVHLLPGFIQRLHGWYRFKCH